jgi:hypothetical protein
MRRRLSAIAAHRHAAPAAGVSLLTRYRDRVLDIGSSPTIAYPKLSDYDEHHVLRPAPRSRTA